MPIAVSGMDALLKKLGSLDSDLRKHEIGALRAGAQVLQKAMVSKAVFVKGYSKGELAENIVIVPGTMPNGDLYTEVGPAKKIYYAGMVEYGTSKMRSQPFVEPAFRETKDEVLKAMADRIRSAIEKRGG